MPPSLHAGGWRRRAQQRSDGGPSCLTATPTTARRLGAPNQSPSKSPRLDLPEVDPDWISSKSPRLDLRETPRGRSGLTKQSELWRRCPRRRTPLLPMKRWQEHGGCSMADSIDRARNQRSLERNQRSLERNQRSLERTRRRRLHAAAAMELCRPRRCMRRLWLSSTCRSSTCRSRAVRLEARR